MNFSFQKFAPPRDLGKFEEGMSLLLAVFILAASSMISFSLGTLVIREIRAARQHARSEAVISSAEGGAESALYFQQRGLTATGNVAVCPNVIHQSLPSFPGAPVSYDVCSNLYDNPYLFVSSFDNMDVILLNDPLNPADTLAAAGYHSLDLTINAVDGGAIGARADVFDLSNPTSDPSEPDFTTSGSAPGNLYISGLDTGKSYAVFIYPCTNPLGSPLACSFGSVSGYVFANGGAKGIPTKNPSVDSTGSGSNLIRKLRIILNR